ncbi:hypothetical protein NL676_019967 [Syzygium grande]|nr:hypothetical protein NL676_019967 [Syzygium grande]
MASGALEAEEPEGAAAPPPSRARRTGGGAPREIRGGGGGARGPRDRRSGGGGRGFRRGGSAQLRWSPPRHPLPPAPAASLPRGHARDVHILSCSFLLIFSASGAAQNFESTADNLGTISLGILHVSFTFFSSVASLVVRSMGPKMLFFLGLLGDISHLYCMYSCKSCSLHEGTIIGALNGEFWGMFASLQVVGNLVSLAVLREEMDGSASGTKLLFIVFVCSMTFGTILMCFLRKRDSREERASPEYPASFHSSLVSLSKSVITPLFDVRMLLIIPLIAYSGLLQAFVWLVIMC